VDTAGNLYVAVEDAGVRVLKLAAGSDTPSVLPFTSGNNYPEVVAVDTAGNVYVTDQQNRVLKLPAG
jgi:serine/threonine-protein kinase